MSHTQTAKSSRSTTRQGRGRGRGRWSNKGNTSMKETDASDERMFDEPNEWNGFNSQKNRSQSNNRRGKEFNANGNRFEQLRENNRSNSRFQNFATENINKNSSSASKATNHSQNPIFVNQLMQRFNSLLPPSNFVVADTAQSNQEKEQTGYHVMPRHLLGQSMPNDPFQGDDMNQNDCYSYYEQNGYQLSEPNGYQENGYYKTNYAEATNSYIEKRQTHADSFEYNSGNEFHKRPQKRVGLTDKLNDSKRLDDPSQGVPMRDLMKSQQKKDIEKKMPSPPKIPAQAQNETDSLRKDFRINVLNKLGYFSDKPVNGSIPTTEVNDKIRDKKESKTSDFTRSSVASRSVSQSHAVKSQDTSYSREQASNKNIGMIENRKTTSSKDKLNSSTRNTVKQEKNVVNPSFSGVLKDVVDFNNELIKEQRASVQRNVKYQEAIRQGNSSPPLYKRDEVGNDLEIAGRPYNIARQAKDHKAKTPTQNEVVERKQAEYQLKQVEHMIKEHEKAEKKRDEYLARYKHVDQGYRLQNAYLDEAAGFDAGFFYTEEQARIRQQEELQRQALKHMEEEKERERRQEQRKEEERKKRMEKYNHIDAGYTLGHADRSTEHVPARYPTQNYHEPEPVEVKYDLTPKKVNTFDRKNKNKMEELPINPEDFLLEGETYDDAIELQKQLLEQAAKAKTQLKQNVVSGNSNQKANQNINISKQEKVTKIRENFHTPTNGRGQDARKVDIKPVPNASLKPAASFKEVYKVVTQNVTKPPSALSATFLDQLKQFEGGVVQKSSNNSLQKPQVTAECKKPEGNRQIAAVSNTNIKPASVAIKSPKGSTLLLRDSEQALQSALASKLRIQDEIDKHGESTINKSRIGSTHQVGIQQGNADGMKYLEAVAKATGAIPKQKNIQVVNGPPPTTRVKPATPTEASQPVPEVEPVVDHQAEMRAARLKMQLEYERSLQKFKEEKASE